MTGRHSATDTDFRVVTVCKKHPLCKSALQTLGPHLHEGRVPDEWRRPGAAQREAGTRAQHHLLPVRVEDGRAEPTRARVIDQR